MSVSIRDSCPNLLHQWRRQIGQRTRLAQLRGPRPFAVVSYFYRAGVLNGMVPLDRLTLVAVFDEHLPDGCLATRFVGIGGQATGHALCFGGPDLTRFDKDLRLPPTPEGRGVRLSNTDDGLLSLALTLERFLERCARHPFMPRRRVPRLPLAPLGDANLRISDLPKRQVIQLTAPERDLVGRSGKTAFDFVNTRFRVAR